MSTLQDHVSNSRTDAERKAGKALLDAIAAQVPAVIEMGGGPNNILPRLKLLAESYALVVHGKAD